MVEAGLSPNVVMTIKGTRPDQDYFRMKAFWEAAIDESNASTLFVLVYDECHLGFRSRGDEDGRAGCLDQFLNGFGDALRRTRGNFFRSLCQPRRTLY